MKLLLFGAVGLLGFANGANDNFKGVATLWGSGLASYRVSLAWATTFTFLGSLAAAIFAGGLAAKFSGSHLVAPEVSSQLPFLAAVALAAAATVLLASFLGLPISTTHALVGALVGAAVAGAGYRHAYFAALATGVVLPLVISPLAALLLTLAVYPVFQKVVLGRDCVCVDEHIGVAAGSAWPSGAATASTVVPLAPSVRWAKSAECETGAEVVRGRISSVLHWLSGAAISFARGMNDAPKIAGVLLVVLAGASLKDYFLVAAVMALGGIVGAARVADTLSKRITPMGTPEAVGANLVSALLVLLATRWALPVSTTHVTTGSIFGIGLVRRREADWKRVWGIVLSWVGTLPLAAVLSALFFKFFLH